MLVTELRRRLVDKAAEVASEGDERNTAMVTAYVRAILVALATKPAEADVAVRDLAVGTGTAALILSLHQEYVRSLIRRGNLEATKENGEFHVALSDLLDFMSRAPSFPAYGSRQATAELRVRAVEWEPTWLGGYVAPRPPDETPEQGEPPA